MSLLNSARIGLLCAMVALAALVSCSGKETAAEEAPKEAPGDTLRVATLYSPLSYFIYRDEPMGYEYESAMEFAESQGKVMDLVVAHSMGKMVELLDSGKVDLIAYDVPQTAEYKDRLTYCGLRRVTWQVLVQSEKGERVTDVTQLAGKQVTVAADTKYAFRLENLNEEIGGGIDILTLDRDTLITDDLIAMVARGEAAYTLADNRVAEVNAPYYPGLNMNMKVSLDQASSWAVAPGDSTLAKAVDEWWQKRDEEGRDSLLHRKYFEAMSIASGRDSGVKGEGKRMLGNGKISVYDQHFRQSAKGIGWDWRLLAAVGYTESKFNPQIRSWAGAAGIMQLMPRTAVQKGLAGERVYDPALNIDAGAKVLRDIERSLTGRVADPVERRRFVLASYNSGLGHVLDAIALAEKYGYDPKIWYGNVRNCVLLKSKPDYYNDPVVKHGYFAGKETVAFVDKVEDTFALYQNNIPLD